MPATGPRHGWYPDPAGSGGQRYWDGSVWTAHCTPPPKRGPILFWGSLSGIGQTLMSSVVIALVPVIAAVTVALNRHPPSNGVNGADLAGGGSASAPADWISSVCRRGSYHPSGGNQLPNATRSSWCQSKEAGTGISFYTYSSSLLDEQRPSFRRRFVCDIHR